MMKIVTLDAVKEFDKLNKNTGHPPTAEEFNEALNALVLKSYTDALRQVIEGAKRTSAIIETSPNDYEVDVSRAYKFFKDLQSALNVLEEGIK